MQPAACTGARDSAGAEGALGGGMALLEASGFRELKGHWGKRERLALWARGPPGRVQTTSEAAASLSAPPWEAGR